MQLPRLLRLVFLILREGKLQHSGRDFSKERRLALQRLAEFVPAMPVGPTLTERVPHPALRMLRAEASFVKSCLLLKGNHLNLGRMPLSYVRIPKAGSTAVIRQILLSRSPELRHVPLDASDINHLASLDMKRQLSPSDGRNKFFTIVRNPFARIVSVYRAFFESRAEPFLYEDYLFGILRREMTFREFVAAVNAIPDWLKDQHVKPQHLFVDYYEKRGIDVEVLKLEFPEDVDAFLKNFGIAFEVFNVSYDSYDYREYYDAELVRLVGLIYKEDISRFGYRGEFAID